MTKRGFVPLYAAYCVAMLSGFMSATVEAPFGVYLLVGFLSAALYWRLVTGRWSP
jgi:hypothetical protein